MHAAAANGVGPTVIGASRVAAPASAGPPRSRGCRMSMTVIDRFRRRGLRLPVPRRRWRLATPLRPLAG